MLPKGETIASKRMVNGGFEALVDDCFNQLKNVKKRKQMPNRIAVLPAGRQALYEGNKYSAAVKSGGFMFVSGQVGRRGWKRRAKR